MKKSSERIFSQRELSMTISAIAIYAAVALGANILGGSESQSTPGQHMRPPIVSTQASDVSEATPLPALPTDTVTTG
jgi:hypothetical protein